MYQMMGDPGTSDTMLRHPTFGIPRKHEFQGQAPNSALEPSVPSFSNSLHRQPPLFFQPLHRPAESFRQDGCEEWSSRDSQPGAGPPTGLRDCAEDKVLGLFCHSEDTRAVMTRARVGEDDLFTFPEGEHDAVTMTARDLASLQPGKFLTDNTIDFYINSSDARKTPRMRMAANSKPPTPPPTPPRSGRKSHTSKYYGVRFRPDLEKWVAEIPVAEWKSLDKKVWLGVFDTEQAAARAVDVARKLLKCSKKRPLNLPCEKLEAYSRQIPRQLILTDLTDTSMFKQVACFIKRECKEYTTIFDATPRDQIIPAFDQHDRFGGQCFNRTSSVNTAAEGYENLPPSNSSDVLNVDVHSESDFPAMILDWADSTCAGFEVTPAGTSFRTSDDNGCNKDRWSDARKNPRMSIPTNYKPHTSRQIRPRSGCKSDTSKYYGVRFRPDLEKWVAEIPVAEWKSLDKKVWLGVFDTEQAAARAVDVARKLLKCSKKRPLNLPCEKLEAYSRQIPRQLILTDLTDTSMFKQVACFIKRECKEYTTIFDATPRDQIIPAFDQHDRFGGLCFNRTSSVNTAAEGYENLPPSNSSDVLNVDVHSELDFPDMILEPCTGYLEGSPAGARKLGKK